MKTKADVPVAVEKLGLLKILGINAAAAIFTQCIFAFGMFGLFQQIFKNAAGLSKEGYFSLMTDAILVSCAFTAIVVVSTEFLVEKSVFFDEKKVLDER